LGYLSPPIAGFLSTSEEIKKIEENSQEISHELNKEIKHVLCADFVAANPKKLPELPSTFACYWTVVYWDTIRKWQDENGKAGQIIDEETVRKTMYAEAESAKSEVRWTEAGNFILYYLLLWVTSFVIFFTGKWIYKGFKAQ
jgi:hypothetical protein